MKIRLHGAFIIAFVALTFVMHEAHEIAHTSIGRWLCGCWGPRDFNVWQLCATCANSPASQRVAGAAGPLFSFMIIWIGYWLLRPAQSSRRQSLGFALVFANMPFGRILTAALGGGDEVYNFKQLTGSFPLAWAAGTALVLVLSTPPLLRAYRRLNNPRRTGLFLAFFLLPLALDVLLVLGGLNTLLAHGVLAGPGLLGSPILVNIWTAIVVLTLAFTYQALGTLAQPDSISATTLLSKHSGGVAHT